MSKSYNQNVVYLVCIICEGPEEYDYLSRIKELDVWDECYKVDIVNAYGNGNIPARYQDKFQNGQYDVVLVFCDTDKKPHEQYIDIKRKIDYFHGVPVSNEVVMFGNPCTMQIIIKHWGDINLTSASKKANAIKIFECTGLASYDAHKEQRKELMKRITRENYLEMISRLENLSKKDNEMNSSNFGYYMKCLEQSDSSWIKRINDLISSE